MIPRLVYSLLSLCSLAATSTTPRQTDAYTLGYDYLPAFSYSTAFSYSYDDDSTNDDCSCSTDDSAATTATICVLRDTTVCWGNLHRYIERTGTSPFDDIQGGRFGAPALGDLDDDGDLDLVVGEEDGIVSAVLKYYENIGNATSPTYEAVTGAASPFYGIDVGWRRKPALADVDGDGDLDLVVGDDDRALNYYENVGSAASPSYKEVDGDASPFDGIWVGEGCGHALGDVDGDGDLDLFVCAFNYYENVGSAASPSYKEVDGDASPFGVIGGSWPALADLDGDGDLDLVVGEYFGALYYYENVGSAASPSYAAVTGSANPFDGIDVGYDIAPALADLDGDGDLDLVVGRNYGALYYFEIVGPAASPNYAALTGTASPFDGIDVGDDSKPALGDLDGDGDLDLVVGEEDGVLNYFENVGSAASPSYVAVTGTANPFDGIDVGDYSAPAFGDVDGDGDLDLVVGCGMPSNSWDDNEKNGVLYYYENIGSAASPTYAAVTGAANPFDGIDVGYDSKPAFADLDDDGDLDLVVGKYDGALYYYENIGSAASPSYEAVNGSANPFDGIDVGYNSAPALADLDGDGDLDLFVSERTGVLNYYMNVGSATAPSYAAVPGTANPFDGVNVGFRGKPAFADLDGDGDLDLVVGEYFGGLNFFANGYCTQGDTACRKKGLCDLTNVVFAEASCQCLGGFDHEVPGEIEQCGECQAGFYGKTCEPCPQGGDEDPNAPRLTDTCGVAGSGRSRGKCDDGVRGDGTCACFGDVFSGSGCTEGTCPAGTVETATFDGYYNNAACTPCAAPFYAPDAGATSCKLADAGFFVDSLGASKQVACDAGKYSGSGAKSCIDCEAGTYQDATGESSCKIAEAGSFVDVAGASRQRPCPAVIFWLRRERTNAELSTLTFEVGTGLVLSGLDAVRFPDDDAAREAFASAVREIVNAPGGGAVFDVSAEDVHLSAGRRRLDAAGSDAVRFVARAVYELVPGETASEGVMEYTKTFYQDTVRTALLDSIESGDAQRAFDRQDATGTSLASVVVDEALSLAMVRGETAVEIGEFIAATDALVVACPPRTYSTSGAASCTPCQPGSYTALAGQTDCKFAEPGSFVAAAGASAQAPCPAGTESTSAAVACSPCRVGYYSNLTKQFACQLCPSPTTTLAEGKTYCDACIGDYYWDQRRYVQHAVETPLAESGQPLPCKDCCLECDGACAVDGDDCVSCPAGTTLESMDLKKNYWRVSERAKKIYECTLEKSCDGGWNSSCAPGHKGPLCGSCEAHFFYDAVKNRCEDCGDKIKATGSNIVGTILAALLLLSVVGVVVRRFGLSEVWTNAVNVFREVVKGEAPEDIATEKMEEQDEPVQAKKSVVVDVEESAANEALEEAETAFLSAARRCFDMIDADGSGTLTRMEIAEAVAGNDEVVEFLRTCGDDNLRLLLQPGRIDVALHVLDPSGDGVIDAVEWEAAVRFPAAFDRMLELFSFVNLSLISFAKPECFGSFRYFDKLVFVTLIPPVVLVAIVAVAALRCSCVARERRPGVVDAAWYWSLFALYVLVPSTSSYCLRYFACVDYEGGYGDDISILQIDPMIACTSNSWKRAWMPYAVIAIFMGKLEIRDGDPELAHVEFLFEEYEPRCYLFIVYEILRRIFLTGVLSMFRAGTISQIAIGLLATIVSHRVFTFYEPYIEDDDDLVSEIAQTELVIVFFYALMVFATAHVGQRDAAFASDAFTYILIVLMSSTFAAALAMVVLGQLGKQDRQDLFESLSKSVTSSFGALAAQGAAGRGGAAGGGGRRPDDAVRTDAADVAARTALGA
ncbi:hypothetical protein JL721_7744 [Aureococcus anophagefferens]|nr:hypothetical protein JL721_7744 [Aureococcus anophagefferens]